MSEKPRTVQDVMIAYGPGTSVAYEDFLFMCEAYESAVKKISELEAMLNDPIALNEAIAEAEKWKFSYVLLKLKNEGKIP